MKNKSLTKISSLLSSPILNNLRIFIIFSIIFVAPGLTYRLVLYPRLVLGTLFHMSYIVAFSITYSYILCIILTFINEPIKKYIGLILVFALWLITTLELYVIIFLHFRLSPFILQLISETDSRETMEFISAYITNVPVIVFFTTVIFTIVFFFFILIKSKNAIKSNNKLFKTWINIILIYSLSVTIFCSLIGRQKLEKLTSLDMFIYSIKQKPDTYKDIERLKQATSSINPIQSNQSDGIEKIVFIIGESFNKYHSSFFGYYLDTNPNLKKLQDNGNLFVYSDVVSPYNFTSDVFKLILSLKSQDDDLYWADTPLFPTIFKKSGWGCFFISNQIIKKNGDAWDYEIGCYLNNKDIEYQTFSGRNDKRHKYDIDLIADYDSLSPKLLKHNLIIFHLIGQHMKYTERYPDNYKYFTTDSIKRNDLKMSQKQAIADYDNATRYNDYVVTEIINKFKDNDAIVIYMPDHGEEVHDYRIQMERTLDPVVSPNMARYQFEIPFMIWTSNTFKEKHPDLTKKIKNSVNRPYLTDDVPHLLLDLSGIQSNWFDPTRSVINDKFNVNRKRLLRLGEDYDKIMMLPKNQN